MALLQNLLLKDVEANHYFKSKDFDEAVNRLNFLNDAKGFGLLSGEPGVGKSCVLRYSVNSLNSNLYKVYLYPYFFFNCDDRIFICLNTPSIIPYVFPNNLYQFSSLFDKFIRKVLKFTSRFVNNASSLVINNLPTPISDAILT